MAKRRNYKAKTRTIYRQAKRRAKRSYKSMSEKPESVIIPSMAYGALRGKINVVLAPVISKVPFGQYADELVMGGLAFMVAKKTSKNSFLNKMARSALMIESASLGQQIAENGFSLNPQTQQNQFTY